MTASHISRLLHLVLLVAMHACCLLAFFTGVERGPLLLCMGLYVLRMFGVTAGYHRYFAHRSFKTSRPFQLVLALLAMSSGQRSVLWWAWHHRHHHRHSDTPADFHSPYQRGFGYAHLLWWMDESHREADLRRVRDLTAFPELLWLHRFYVLPSLVLALLCYALGGAGGFVVGFCWSTVLVWHATFTINSLAHVWGSRDHDTDDDSRNNGFLALLTLGEGWHNNHHRYPGSARQGMLPSQIDLTWLALCGLARVGLVWDLRSHSDEAVQAYRERRASGVPVAAWEANRVALGATPTPRSSP